MDLKERIQQAYIDPTGELFLHLGDDYLIGNNGIIKDQITALKYYLLSGEKGNYYAYYNVACMYLFGDGVDKDIDMALKYYVLASDLGDKEAAFHAGEIYFYEKHDNANAEKYLHKASLLNSLGGKFTYGLFLIDQNKIDEGIKFIKDAAKRGNGYALLYLGDLYLEGKYVLKDEKKALEYYLSSSSLKVQEACLKASECYKNGIGTEIDLLKAEEYLNKSKEKFED